ncbi:MAG: DegT/DnrJ/EryC1/StrS aminotransferase, partial [Sediminibacterium sp.]|nr:DegT/DnrJ/EryC1/StrS aminotransferase [Sediminibacterium sp.]
AIEKDSDKRYAGQRSWDFDVKRQGYRYHMSNLFAAIGRTQLTRLDNEFGPKRTVLSERYRSNLKGQKGIRFQKLPLNAEIIPHIFPILIADGKRDSLRELLQQNNVQTGIHYKPNHLLGFYGGGNESLPVTEAIYNEIISLPLHPELELSDVDLISSLIIEHLT